MKRQINISMSKTFAIYFTLYILRKKSVKKSMLSITTGKDVCHMIFIRYMTKLYKDFQDVCDVMRFIRCIEIYTIHEIFI